MGEFVRHIPDSQFRRLVFCFVTWAVTGTFGSISMTNAGEVAPSAKVFTIQIPMRDGTQQTARVSLPPGDGPWPVVLQRFYWANSFSFGERTFHAGGYATVQQQFRDADGKIGTRFRQDDIDGYDSVEWIARQRWCNRQVVMYGKSAGGITALAAASARPPSLKAIIPMNNGVSWKWGYRANGAVTLAMAANGRAIPAINKEPWLSDRDAYKFLPLADLDKHVQGKENPLWNQIVFNSEYNNFYKADVTDLARIAKIRVPALFIAGWWDYYAGCSFEAWKTVKRSNPDLDVRIIVGATNHVSQFPRDGRDYKGGREDAAGEAVRWLDFVLRGRKNGLEKQPPVKVFTMKANRWQRYDTWPPPGAAEKVYLHNATPDRFGTLDVTPPGDEPASEYDYDPDDPVPTLGGNHSIHYHHPLVPAGSFDHSAHEKRADVLVFSTGPLAKDTEVTGPIDLTLWASTDGRDTDWTAILLDVEPSGTPYNVTMGILRARYHRGIYRPPELLTPGKPYRFTFDLMPTSYVFRKGHRIRLHVSSSNFPLWDRNPNTGGAIATETRTRVAHQTIFHHQERPSHIRLPVVRGGLPETPNTP